MTTVVYVFHPVCPTRFSVASFSFSFMHPNDTILPKLKLLMFAIPELIKSLIPNECLPPIIFSHVPYLVLLLLVAIFRIPIQKKYKQRNLLNPI